MKNLQEYHLTFIIRYRRSIDEKHYAQITWSSVSRLPRNIVFGLIEDEELPFGKFAEKFSGLGVDRGKQIALYIRNLENGKSCPFSFSFDRDWQTPDDWGSVIEVPGSLNITKAIKAVL